MSVYFIGCLHLGDKWMAQHRGFQDEFYHDEHLIDTWNSIISKRDLVWILGDVTMESKEHYHQLDRLKGRKKVCLGNHDLPEHTRELLKHVETVAGMVDYKGFVLSHCPIHPNEIGFCRGNIHSHIHHENKLHEVVISSRYDDPKATLNPTLHKYWNVDAKLLNFKPKSLDSILEEAILIECAQSK